jgi:gluconolactonase
MTVVEADRPEFEKLVSPDATLTKIGEGYEFSEGPVWSVAEQALYFSDIPGDKRFRWTESGGMELVMAPTFKGNGMAFDVEGRLIVCEHVSSSITRFHADGFHETVCFHHQGVYLNSPNDLVARARDGYIYVTDPDYGRWNDWIGCERVPLLGFKAVFRVPHEGGEAELVVDREEFEQPNGLCFSPDESLLYVNDSPRAHIKVFEVADDGSLVNGRLLAEGIGGTIEGGSPDGMECDEFGNVWTTGPGGVWVFNPDGERLGIIRTPEVCGSLCWGGPDLRTLFLTTSTTVHRIPALCTSAPLPHYDLGG